MILRLLKPPCDLNGCDILRVTSEEFNYASLPSVVSKSRIDINKNEIMETTYNFTTRNKLLSFVIFFLDLFFKTHVSFQMKYNHILHVFL